MALSADSRPHFTTIAAFVSNLEHEIASLFGDVLLYASELGLIGKEHFAVDGCKLPSNASKKWSGTHEELEKKRQKLERVAEGIVQRHRDEQVGAVQVFAITTHFVSEAAIYQFVHPSYTEDGDAIPSDFMLEVQLEQYEPACIEIVTAQHALPIRLLLNDASYAAQWSRHLPETVTAAQAICIFSPTKASHPETSTLLFCGVFSYRIPLAHA